MGILTVVRIQIFKSIYSICGLICIEVYAGSRTYYNLCVIFCDSQAHSIEVNV
jgi:hypothetical protein